MVLYKCEKCNKEFNQKSNYILHTNRKKPCNINITDNIIINEKKILYKCEKCNKDFYQKSNYVTHINKKIPCNNNINIEDKCKILEYQNKNLIKENDIIKNKNLILEEENKKINELYNNLLDKCIKNSTNTTNNTNTINNNNIINITLTNFGNEDCNILTNDEQLKILKSNKQCLTNLIKYLHTNDRLPEYKNICIKNLRSKGGYLYEGNKWLHCNFENLLTILFKNKINDLEKIKSNNEELSDSYVQNIQKLIDNYDDDIDLFIKNNKDNIINMLYNNTKNYKI
jgi:uncharacterized C2H2 Zn-finger protein